MGVRTVVRQSGLSSASKQVIPDIGTGYAPSTTAVVTCDRYRTAIRPLDGGDFDLLSFDSG